MAKLNIQYLNIKQIRNGICALFKKFEWLFFNFKFDINIKLTKRSFNI